MHFEILVEDQSGKKALDILIPKIVGNQHKFKVRPTEELATFPKISPILLMRIQTFCSTNFPCSSGRTEKVMPMILPRS